ncbi:hypothetical protein ABFS83_05G082200 [Erythranthe nasuta]
MIKLLRRILVISMFKIDWKKLFFIFGIFTVFNVLIQVSTIPNPLVGWIFQPQDQFYSFKSHNNIVLSGETSHWLGVDNHPENLRDTPLVVTLNSSAKVNQSSVVPSSPLKEKKESKQRRRYQLPLKPNEVLIFVKRDIENAPLEINDDPELYAPLFRNISTFKRSYEWMERILKVYIYQEGEKPIFHQPQLRGIYASEGWFMKLMEQNRQFVTKDPQKAHLFYLPYSARQLQMALYVPNSHNMKPLSIFLRDYVNMLASKYPFWNRTHGADHFLVACHDWGPYTLTEHEELTKNTIKALCNADVSQWIFVGGKDVSLPETIIRNPRKFLKGLGGRRVSQRPILAFFAGNNHGRVRPILIKNWSEKDRDMRIYGPLPNKVSRVMSYSQHMKSSKYCICPMGFEVNSPRIVEAIYYECVPVIIADNFIPPLNDVLNCNAFSVIVAENDIPKLKEILLAIPLRQYLTMQTNIKRLKRHFLWNLRPIRYDLFHMILHSIWYSRVNQIQIPHPH